MLTIPRQLLLRPQCQCPRRFHQHHLPARRHLSLHQKSHNRTSISQKDWNHQSLNSHRHLHHPARVNRVICKQSRKLCQMVENWISRQVLVRPASRDLVWKWSTMQTNGTRCAAFRCVVVHAFHTSHLWLKSRPVCHSMSSMHAHVVFGCLSVLSSPVSLLLPPVPLPALPDVHPGA